MPAAKPKASGTPDIMNAEDRIDNIIRQAIGKEPLFSFPRASENPIHWIQLLNALDPQGVSNSLSEFPGWPLLFPLKVQLQKCDKCSREFCSPVNYRRHTRVHHRLKKLNKDYTKTRELLGAYWDKLSVEKAKEVVSFKDVMLEEVPGSSILKALISFIQRQAFSPLPPYYLRAGAALLDIVQSRPSSFPISSHELFSILDDASERTCFSGSAVSMQKYVFDGEAGKTCLEPRNLVACTSFLLEQILVKAWLADKDAEALRCQKQLVEEEEMARKRQAEILEKKRQKKLRQKEQKAREQRNKAEAEIKGNIDNTVKALSPAEASLDTYNLEAHSPNTFADNATFQYPDTNEEIDGGADSGYDFVTDQNIEKQSEREHNHQHVAVARHQGQSKSPRAVSSDFDTNQNSPISKLEVIQKYGTHHDQKASANGSKVWSRKPKTEIDKTISNMIEKESHLLKNQEVLIGSISVNLGNCSLSEGNEAASVEDYTVENLAKQNNSQDKPLKPDFVMSRNNQSTAKLWRPVSRLETKDPLPVQSGGTEADAVPGNGDAQNLSGPSCLRSCSIDDRDIGSENNLFHLEGRPVPASFRLSCQAAKAFLAQRWKEAISSKHATLLVCTDSEPSGSQQIEDSKTEACQSSDVDGSNILTDADKRLPATSMVTKSKPRFKSGKANKTKYIPKRKTTT